MRIVIKYAPASTFDLMALLEAHLMKSINGMSVVINTSADPAKRNSFIAHCAGFKTYFSNEGPAS